MGKTRVLIADDEALARDELLHILGRIPDVRICAQAKNGIEALKKIEKENPDLVFLDIEMPGLNGIEVAKRLAANPNPPKIIFATAYDTYAVSAFEVNAVDYVLKPFDPERIKKSLKKVLETEASKDVSLVKINKLISSLSKKKNEYVDKIPIKLKGRINLVDVDDIVYVKSQGGLVYVCEEGKELLSDYTSLEKVQEELDPEKFHRTHRGFLVNMEKMKEISPIGAGHFTIKCKTKGGFVEIPLSRRQARDLRKKYKF